MVSKWFVGDRLKPKYLHIPDRSAAFLFVREIHTVTCSAGTQVFYTGRLVQQQLSREGKVLEEAMNKDLWKFHENELEEAPTHK